MEKRPINKVSRFEESSPVYIALCVMLLPVVTGIISLIENL